MNDWTEIKEIGYWDNIEYRIKPEPKYRPFKDAEECWNEMQKHQPFGWTKLIGTIEYSFITDVNDSINWDSKAAAFYFGQDFLVHYPSENMVVVGNEFDI